MAKQKQPIKGVFQKNRYWYARIDGREVYCGKGEKGHKMAVAAKAKEIARKYENQEIGAGLKVKRSEFKTVGDLLEWYMAIPKVKEKVFYRDRKRAKIHLIEFMGKLPVRNLDAGIQEEYREYRKKQTIKNGTINNEIALLSVAYHLAMKRKKIPVDAMPGEFVRVEDINPRRRVTDEEYNELLKHAPIDFKDFLVCGYESAMRSSEISKLTKSQLKLNIQHISGEYVDYIDLGIFDTKNKTRRIVPVGENLKKILKRRVAGLGSEDLIFTFDGRKYDHKKIHRLMKATCKLAGIPYGDQVFNQKGERIGIVFHCFRHTRISKWVEMGFSDEIVRRASGHKSLESYQRYVKLDPVTIMRLVEKPKHDKNTTKSARSL